MKKTYWLVVLAVLAAMVGVAPQGHAAADVEGSAQKLGRGFAHVIASPFYLPKNIIQTAVDTEPHWMAPWQAMTQGLGQGIFLMGRQAVSGFRDVFTFWDPGPPMYDPESLIPEI
jgi:hypothetical protein